MISNLDKSLEIGRETVQAAEQLMAALEKLAVLEAKRVNSGINLPDFDDNFGATPGLTHVNGATLNGVLFTSAPAIIAFMEANSHDDNFQQARP